MKASWQVGQEKFMECKRKFSIFISSTYEDLKDERQVAMRIALENDLIPVGMEQFHAAPVAQWDLIAKMINDCDFYLLIIGGRYGSMEEKEQISYTEKEYKYSKEKGMPVYAFIKKEKGITKEKMDKKDTYKKQEKLSEFRDRVKNDGNTVDFFDDIKDLEYKLSASLRDAKEYADANAGWVRVHDIHAIVDGQNNNTERNGANELQNQCDAVANMQAMLEVFSDSLKAVKESVSEKRTFRVEGETLYIE